MPTHPGLTGSDLHVDSGKKPSVTVTATTYTMDGTKLVILGDTTTAGADIGVTLPNPATFADYDFEIKCIGSAHHTVVISPFAAEQIDLNGGSTYILYEIAATGSQVTGAILHSDGTNWWVMSVAINQP